MLCRNRAALHWMKAHLSSDTWARTLRLDRGAQDGTVTGSQDRHGNQPSAVLAVHPDQAGREETGTFGPSPAHHKLDLEARCHRRRQDRGPDVPLCQPGQVLGPQGRAAVSGIQERRPQGRHLMGARPVPWPVWGPIQPCPDRRPRGLDAGCRQARDGRASQKPGQSAVSFCLALDRPGPCEGRSTARSPENSGPDSLSICCRALVLRRAQQGRGGADDLTHLLEGHTPPG